MKGKSVEDILILLDGLRCYNCRARLIVVEKGGRTIIKNKLLVIDERKGIIEIKCRECGRIKTIISKS
jgi:ribosomal protein S27E